MRTSTLTSSATTSNLLLSLKHILKLSTTNLLKLRNRWTTQSSIFTTRWVLLEVALCLANHLRESWIRRRCSANVRRSFRSRSDSATSKDFRTKSGKEPSYPLSPLILTKHFLNAIRSKSPVKIKQRRLELMPHNNWMHTSHLLPSNNYIVRCKQKLTSLTLKREAELLKTGWTSNSKVKGPSFRVEMKRIYWPRNVNNSSLKWSRLCKLRWKRRQEKKRQKNNV